MRFVAVIGLLIWGCSSSSTPVDETHCERDADCVAGEYCGPGSRQCLPLNGCILQTDCARTERCEFNQCISPEISVELLRENTPLFAFDPEVTHYDLGVDFLVTDLTLLAGPIADVASMTWRGEPIAPAESLTLQLSEEQNHVLRIESVTGIRYEINVLREGVSSLQQSDRMRYADPEGNVMFTSIATDGKTLVVGDSSHQRALVHSWNGIAWTLETELVASIPRLNDTFGRSVAVDGDTIVVGAMDHGADGPRKSGAVFVYARKNGVWQEQAYLKASNPGENDRFGNRVAIDGKTIVVAAEQESGASPGVNGPDNDAAAQSGAVYIFVQDGDAWTQQAYLKAANPSMADKFGRSIAISGNTVVVGAPQEGGSATGVNGAYNDNAQYAGAAYVFVRDGTTWSQQAYLKSSVVASRFMGQAVAVDGDRIVVGASGTMDTRGSAYTFTRTGTQWVADGLLDIGTDAGDAFGLSVAILGDVIAVGAPWEDGGIGGVNGTVGDNSIDYAGAVYVYSGDGPRVYLKATSPAHRESFGDQIFIAGDRLIVGGFLADTEGFGIGSHTYTFH